jgi:hypothetical protein
MERSWNLADQVDATASGIGLSFETCSPIMLPEGSGEQISITFDGLPPRGSEAWGG